MVKGLSSCTENGKKKCGSLLFVADDPYMTVVNFRRFFCDRQSDPRAWRLVSRLRASIEAFKYALAVLLPDNGAFVVDGDQNL
jgi:hypothetical protein